MSADLDLIEFTVVFVEEHNAQQKRKEQQQEEHKVNAKEGTLQDFDFAAFRGT
jgi:hypothetical protein